MAAVEQASEKARHKNEKIGEVVSTKMAKTIVVEVTRRVPHPVYKRIVSKRRKFYAHDEQQTAKVGDVVRIVECRPLSRLKRWSLGGCHPARRAGGRGASGSARQRRHAREEDHQEEVARVRRGLKQEKTS